MSTRSEALAMRLEQGAQSLLSFAERLSDTEWRMICPQDGRTVGALVYHVASVYPVEIDLAQALAAGKPIEGVTWDVVAEMNAGHAQESANVSKAETLRRLRENSAAAAKAVRALSDEQLNRAASVSLNDNAPLTTQFIIEDHALRHSFHHLANIRATVGR
jgi:hypothetical protein